MFSALMSLVYHAISAVLLFWHAVWDDLLGDPHSFATDWSWALGIVFLVLTVRTLLLPLYLKQVKSQRALQRVQPQIRELQAEHKGDPQALQLAMAELMRREKFSPIGSFLPMLLQVPILIGLLHVLRHLRPTITDHAGQTLYGWTVTQFADASHATLFGAPIAATFRSSAAELAPLGADPGTVQIVAAVLIAAMITVTFLTTRMSILKAGWSENPQQRTVQRFILYGIPVSLLVSGAIFPVGVVLYWTTQSLFALGQQIWINRRYPAETPSALPLL
jgi:YidC/Oxa1 family membrane protein insertase